MDDFILASKQCSILSRLNFASRTGNKEKAKRLSTLWVVLARMEARNAINDMLAAREAYSEAKRAVKKAKESGVVFALSEKRVQAFETTFREKEKELAQIGGHTAAALDMWQECGATLYDFANLCNRSYDEVVREIGPKRLDAEFSELIFICNLDYKDNRNRGFIDYDVDAPLTHAIKDYWLDLMLHTPEGREASHEAMEAVFPEIMENALTLVTDADGAQHLIDKDGVEVGTVGEENCP